ncbi:MAG: fructose-6-phosphate aldolase [Myxococcales bacterium]|nr:fructose-6-phosphate aldolase [Myxococcales bacterium]|tara:strand:+ start:199 stop:846 length:648 start_codon:yes stop_codon:yes gene_type:complete
MKFFIDTADVGEIREAQSLGILDGVTTNPTLIAKTGRPFEEVIAEICEFVPGPVSAEAVAETAEDFISQGRQLASIAKNVVVKLPLNTAGLKACRALSIDGIKTNVTLVFQPIQALMAAKAGATYVSPFIGRLDDVGTDGMNLIADIVRIFDNYQFETEVLAASIRHPVHVLQSALAGAHVSTIPMSVFDKLVSHPLTTSGIERFNADFAKIPQT